MTKESLKSKKNSLLSYGAWAMVFLLWSIYTIVLKRESVMIPSPIRVWETFISIARGGYSGIPFSHHLRASFVRLFLSLLLGFITAVPLGFLSGYSQKTRSLVDSFIQFYRPIPPLAYYPLLILWMGIDDRSKIMLLFLAAFAPIYIACVSAIGNIRKDYILSAKSLGASPRKILLNIIWPACLPEIFTGLRNAFGFAYTTLVAAEMTAATSGIGWMVIDASRYLKSDVMFVGIFIMGLSGLIIDKAMLYVEKNLVFWKGRG